MQTLEFSRSDHVAVVLAHPDDELMLGNGLSTAVEQAGSVTVVTLTAGTNSTVGPREFVQSGGRLTEQEASLTALKIAEDDQLQGTYLDESLGAPDIIDDAAAWIEQITRQRGINRYITLGRRGVDKHADHVGSHRIATLSAGRLLSSDIAIDLLALNHLHRGQLHAPHRPGLKDDIIDFHRSQDLRRPDVAQKLGALLHSGETYDRIQPAALPRPLRAAGLASAIRRSRAA